MSPRTAAAREGNGVYEVAIVGAGPAGLAAASVLREHGVRVAVIDEQLRAGGQILRQPPAGFSVEHWLPGRSYDRVKRVLRAVGDRPDIDWRLGATVLGLTGAASFRTQGASAVPHRLWIQDASGSRVLEATAVLVATGCYERPLAFPGWTLPGVMGAGAIQAFVKSQQFVPGERFVLTGSHPLQLVVADQLLRAGARVAAVTFTQPPTRAAAVLRYPLAMLQQARQMVDVVRILARLRRAGVAVRFGTTIVRADGGDSIASATLAPMHGGAVDGSRWEVVECDRIGVCHGFIASSELARQAGAGIRWGEHEGGWLIEHDAWLESSVANLFVAGEVTSVMGADAALEKGRIAAIGILRTLGRIGEREAQRLAAAPRRRLRRLLRFASMLQELSRPPEGLERQVVTGESLVCRCESITRAYFDEQLRENTHVASADAAKLLTRAGMGMCQGRLCGDNVARLVALARGLSPGEVGPLHARMPVKPVPLGTLCRDRCG
ncbi:MAG TPA: FAD-dependent oxidoreductase [Povalibacter sp.]|nr:FAD-dependent oxidoreductase [Povalibacter sp.]